jgi:hypothetical protein
VIKLVFFITVGCILLALAGFVLFCMGYALLAGLFGLDTTSLYWCMGAGVWTGLCIFVSAAVTQEIIDRRQRKPAGPFKQYIIDKHNKVCSLIEFKD